MKEKTTSQHLYLRTIYRLSQEMSKVRNVDIAKELGYSKPSVTNAMKKLCDDGLICSNKENGIQLTERGLALAEESTERCDVLTEYFMKLGLKKEAAYENARLVGSRITDELFELIRLKVTCDNKVEASNNQIDPK